MAKWKKVIICLGLVCTLVGCQSNSQAKNTQDEFSKLIDQLPMLLIENDDLIVNQLVDNLDKYHLKDEIFNWEVPSLKKTKKIDDIADEYQHKLSQINYDELDDEQRLTYDSVMGMLKDKPKGLSDEQYFYLDNNPLGKYNGVLNNIPTSFLVLEFKDKNDVKSYINLLNTLDDYFAKLVQFEQTRQNKGFGMTPSEIKAVRKDCLAVAKANVNWLTKDFDDKLSQVDFLNKKEKKQFKRQLDVANFSSSFKSLYEQLGRLKVKVKDGTLLKDYPGGKAYYRYLIQYNTGFTKISDYKKYIDSKVDFPNPSGSVFDRYEQYAEQADELDGNITSAKSFNKVLDKIEAQQDDRFTSVGKVDFDMQELPKELAPIYEGIGAFYMPSEIDRPNSKEIMMGVGSFKDDAYTSVAHEGYPGHMYQHVFYKKVKHPFIRDLMASPWYSEGYANYVQEISCDYSDNRKVCVANEVANSFIYFTLIQMDYAINYQGDIDLAQLYLEEVFSLSKKDAKATIQQLAWSPASFVPYYVGGAMINDMLNKFGDVDNKHYVKRFNTAFNEIGPADPKTVYKWIRIKLKEN